LPPLLAGLMPPFHAMGGGFTTRVPVPGLEAVSLSISFLPLDPSSNVNMLQRLQQVRRGAALPPGLFTTPEMVFAPARGRSSHQPLPYSGEFPGMWSRTHGRSNGEAAALAPTTGADAAAAAAAPQLHRRFHPFTAGAAERHHQPQPAVSRGVAASQPRLRRPRDTIFRRAPVAAARPVAEAEVAASATAAVGRTRRSSRLQVCCRRMGH